MIVASFALDRLNDHGGDVEAALFNNLPDLCFGRTFICLSLAIAGRFRERKVDPRSRNSRPGKLGKILCLARLRIRKAQRVAAPAMKCALEMEYFHPTF